MTTSSSDLAGRVVVVTGAARGQGRAITERLVAEGALVIAGDVLDAVLELADAHPGAVHAAIHDVTDADSWSRLLVSGVEAFGRIDGLVNNAGVLRRKVLERERAADFEATWRVNCLGAFLGIQLVVPHLRASGGGAIVNTISTVGTEVPAGYGAYASSKWALRGLTKAAALELAPEGIRVNAVLPGPVLTPMVLGDGDERTAAQLARTPLGRAGVPEDIAELVLFLLSDRSSFMVGAEVAIDGGQTAGIAMPARVVTDTDRPGW
jgi:3alpha(or 20beta)-hydroxysteroid dehydrogenase